MSDGQPPTELPTADEITHLRGAKTGDMYRTFRGTIVINPEPNAKGHRGARGSKNLRRNAKREVVTALLEKKWLAEGPTRFIVTAAGDAVIAADDRRRQLHTELYRERFGVPE